MSRLNSVKDKLSREWLENKHIRIQPLQQFIGKTFDKNVESELQKYCTPRTYIQISKNRESFETTRELSSMHVLDNSDVWILCLLNELNVILDIDFAMG